MSGTQSTLTDRFPKKATRTASVLSKDHPPDKKAKSDKSAVPLAHEFDPTGLVQRCVIIQKDENGFGLTVSGDNPVFVQLVKEDGAAMRAGVQTGDRIIKVNGTLVTHSNHVEVVKLIKSGSYVALTVLGRPPGLVQIPLGEGEPSLSPSLSSPRSPGSPPGEQRCPSSFSSSFSNASSPTSPQDHGTSPLPLWEESNAVHSQKVDILQKMLTKEQQDLQAMKDEYSRTPRPKLLRDIQEASKHIPLLQGQLHRATSTAQDGVLSSRDSEVEERIGGGADGDHAPSSQGSDKPWTNNNNTVTPILLPESLYQRETPCHSPKTPRDSLNSCPSPDAEDTPDMESSPPGGMGSPSPMGSPAPSPRLHPQIIGAEDDYFDTEQEQINGQCSCFQSIELLKSRPAHLAAFLHHVVSQFDPAPLMCYLYADLYKQTNSKETRRVFMDLHSFFMDRAANLKVAVPEPVASELERRRPELIPEELHRQYTQLLQDTLLCDITRNLEDFRQKRSMGLTLAEGELAKLDAERMRDRVALERERACAEHIISKIEDVLLASQPTEEERCSTMQYVILTYMKHLGVKVKEPRALEHKRRINFLPKMKKSIKPEREGEEKVKKPRFPSILGPPRRPSRVDSTSIGKAMEMNKQRPQKQPSQPSQPSALGVSELSEASSRVRSSQSSDGSEAGLHPASSLHPASPPPLSSPAGQGAEHAARDSDSSLTPSSAPPRPWEGLHSGDAQDAAAHPTSPHFDFPCALDQLQEEREEREEDRALDGGTPRASRRMEGFSALTSADVQSEDDQGNDIEVEQDPPSWQQLVSREVLGGLTPQEIKRQEVINELFYTERAHLRMLRVLDYVFYQKLSRDGILPPGDIRHIFTNLEDIVQLHVSITDQMTAIRKSSETSVIGQIGDDFLAWFSGAEEEKIKRAVGMFCSNQPFALELIKTRQKKDQRFTSFMQEAESNRLCRRLQLKDIIPVEMQRLTKYPLLLESIAKYTEEAEEREKVRRAAECCKKILNYVNQAVKEAENKQRLEDYQRRLDLSSLKQSENPMISEFKSLDLTKRKMVHEGPLSWKVNKDKTIELYTLLLEDVLVLLQKQDERLVLKCHSKNLAGTADTKHIFSPVIKLSTVLVRSVATDNKSFFVLSMSDNGAQIYELMAQTVSEQRTWQCLITQSADTMKTKPHPIIPLPQTDVERDAVDIISTTVPRLSKDPDHASSGPDHASSGPDHASTGPDHAPIGPDHASSGPDHASSGPDHASTGPDHASTGPDHASTGPDHASTGPDHASSGPDHASTGPGHAPIGPDHASTGPDHAPTGPDHASSGPDHASTGGIQSPEKHLTSSLGLQAPPTGTNPFEGAQSEDEEEEPMLPDRGAEGEEEEEEVGAFLEASLADRLPFLQERSRQGIAVDDQEPDAFGLPPSRAEEALRTLAALKQVLLNHMTSREEEGGGEKEQEKEQEKDQEKHQEKDQEKDQETEQWKGGVSGGRLLRTASLRVAEDGGSTSASGAAETSAVSSENGGGSDGAEMTGRTEDSPPEPPSGHTGFFEPSEEYGSYMVLEGYGGSGESSTDDDAGLSGEGGVQWGSVGDSGIDLKKLLSSTSQTGGAGPNLSRQVMTHIRLLQASLQHLKEVETKYNQLCQRLSDTATDSEDNKDNS